MKISSRFTIGQQVGFLILSSLISGLGIAGGLVAGFVDLEQGHNDAFVNQESASSIGHISEQAGVWLVTIDTIFVEPQATSGALESLAVEQGHSLSAQMQALATVPQLHDNRDEVLTVATSMQRLTASLETLQTASKIAEEKPASRERIRHLAAPIPKSLVRLQKHLTQSSAKAASQWSGQRNQLFFMAGLAATLYALFAFALWRRSQSKLSNPLRALAGAINRFSEPSTEPHSMQADPEDLQSLSASYRSMVNELEEADSSNQALRAETNALLESIPAILIGLDPNGKVVLWNAAATRNFGLIRNQALNRPITEVPIPWSDNATPQSLMPENIEQSVQVIPEVTFSAANGERRVLSLTTTPVSYGAQGNGILVLGTDMTEQRLLESRVRHSQKLESVGQLAAGIAHEINTPIQYVGDSIHFLQEAFEDMHAILESYKELRLCVQDVESAAETINKVREAEEDADLELLEEEMPGAIERAIEGVQRVANIVGAMKRFAHPGASNFAPADLNEAVRTTLTVANNELRYIAKVNQQLGSIPAVECDLGDINQVLLNLIVNAAHAIEETSDEQGTITVRTRFRDDNVVVEISDTGCGIPADAADNIFDPFFTTKEVGKGTGQGLAIAHSIVCEKHGGQLTFDSSPERGTTFFIELPVRQGVAA